jgi:hypothetical protein
MSDQGAQRHWWKQPGESILHEQDSSGRYQYVDSAVRRRLPATYALTDQRVVAYRTRGRLARQQILPMDVPLDKLRAFGLQRDFRGQGSYFRPFPGRRVLRLEIDHLDRLLVLGIVFRPLIADAWLGSLRDLRPDITPPTRDQP